MCDNSKVYDFYEEYLVVNNQIIVRHFTESVQLTRTSLFQDDNKKFLNVYKTRHLLHTNVKETLHYDNFTREKK